MSTYFHNRRANQAAKYLAPSLQERRADLDRANRTFAAQHPQVGELMMRKGRPVFYVTAPEYREAADPRDLVGTP